MPLMMTDTLWRIITFPLICWWHCCDRQRCDVCQTFHLGHTCQWHSLALYLPPVKSSALRCALSMLAHTSALHWGVGLMKEAGRIHTPRIFWSSDSFCSGCADYFVLAVAGMKFIVETESNLACKDVFTIISMYVKINANNARMQSLRECRVLIESNIVPGKNLS